MTNTITQLMQREIVELAKQQKSAAEIGRIVGCSERSVHRVGRRYGVTVGLRRRPLNAAEDEIVLSYARGGATILMIARKLGRSTSAVVSAAKRLGVRFPRRERVLYEEIGGKGTTLPSRERMAAFVEAGKAELARARP